MWGDVDRAISIFGVTIANHVTGTELACDASSHAFGDGRGEVVVELAINWIPVGDDVVSPNAKIGAWY